MAENDDSRFSWYEDLEEGLEALTKSRKNDSNEVIKRAKKLMNY